MRLASTAAGAQIDHLVQAVAEKVIGHSAAFKTPRKQALLNIYLRVLFIQIHPISQAFVWVSGGVQGRQKIASETMGIAKELVFNQLITPVTRPQSNLAL
jgi:hypothetical protein